MKVFQRIEVWILLLLAAGAGLFVLVTSRPVDPDELPLIRNAGPATGEKPALRRLMLERDHGNARLDIEVRVTNSHPKKQQLVPPFARLLNAAGKEVPAFFLPIEPPPTLDPQTTADVRLRFWLETSDLAGALTLELDGNSLPIKSPTPFDLTPLTNAKAVVVEGLDWAVK